jgi:hypothetical protein
MPRRYKRATEEIFANSALAPLVAFSDAPTIAQVLGVLNTNSHELEDLGGSGLFAIASLCQHRCVRDDVANAVSASLVFMCWNVPGFETS